MNLALSVSDVNYVFNSRGFVLLNFRLGVFNVTIGKLGVREIDFSV